MSLPRIWAVGFSKLAGVYGEIVADYASRADVRLVAQGYEAAVETVRRGLLERAPDAPGTDVVIAAGSNGEYLRDRLAAPVVLVGVDGFDVLDALASARRAGARVALMSHGETFAALERFAANFALDVPHFSYRGAADAETRLRALQADGVEAVVGPGLVSEIAERIGMTSVFLYSHTRVRAAFDTALSLADAAAQEAAKRRTLDAVLSQLRDGVVALDARGRVLSANPAACTILGQSASVLHGRELEKVAPDLSAALREPQDETIQSIGGRDYWVRRGRFEAVDGAGAVLTVQAADDLARGENSLRARRPTSLHAARHQLADLRGDAPALTHARALASRYARTDGTVLLTGATGTGKEVLAQGMHRESARARGPFVAVNCGALSESLLESELFGYEEGAFTGARRGGRAGLIEAAHRGTLFLDEIGEMPLALQTRLLRVLQEREVTRVGGTRAVRVDLRVIAATHRDLAAAAAAGEFRADLFYRLNVLRIALPPLSARGADVLDLAAQLLSEAVERVGQGVARDAARCRLVLQAVDADLLAHDWPGNVRELASVVERIACLWVTDADASPDWRLDTDLFFAIAPECRRAAPRGRSLDTLLTNAAPLKVGARALERQLIEQTLVETGGDRAATCRQLGISRATLWRRLR
ncbi:propionate catabolism operon regulatory protein PrpR [Chitinasiproducens palmae]|uniref:Transcriptional regulator, propionate catabolism operon regulatory protein n=1 Tax=Chitinasiproducens palmae TaxID=1770053 RepID=A0A1H2PUA8_9BURK|nr:propionate catabolism operon regulatory protein PrpR [Chitinasiproducens palmae]SDV49911.1 transcriptional regulator, propionate catabolism operon regulatory protein [Chitinasiproducens palmae]